MRVSSLLANIILDERRVKELTGRNWFVSMYYRLKNLAHYARGWMNYFGVSTYYRPIQEVDHQEGVRECSPLVTPAHTGVQKAA